jgi:hypothetical protein
VRSIFGIKEERMAIYKNFFTHRYDFFLHRQPTHFLQLLFLLSSLLLHTNTIYIGVLMGREEKNVYVQKRVRPYPNFGDVLSDEKKSELTLRASAENSRFSTFLK